MLSAGNWPKTNRNAIAHGWTGEWRNPNTVGFNAHAAKYNHVVQWIHDNVERPYKNAHWAKIGDCIYVQIKKPKDFVLFTLRWGV